jgi:hypothetical protein
MHRIVTNRPLTSKSGANLLEECWPGIGAQMAALINPWDVIPLDKKQMRVLRKWQKRRHPQDFRAADAEFHAELGRHGCEWTYIRDSNPSCFGIRKLRQPKAAEADKVPPAAVEIAELPHSQQVSRVVRRGWQTQLALKTADELLADAIQRLTAQDRSRTYGSGSCFYQR